MPRYGKSHSKNRSFLFEAWQQRVKIKKHDYKVKLQRNLYWRKKEDKIKQKEKIWASNGQHAKYAILNIM